MRVNLRIKIRNYTLFGMISKTQTLEGITSKAIGETNKHYIFWDLENCTLEQAKETLQDVQYEFKLGDILITSDIEKSFRAWCYSKRTFKTFIHILLHTKYIDYNFIYWTIQRGNATLRTSQKENRKPQEIIAVLRGYEKTEIPNKVIHVTYETGNDKHGKVLILG